MQQSCWFLSHSTINLKDHVCFRNDRCRILFLFDYWSSTGWVEVLHTWLQTSSDCGLKEIVRWIIWPRSTSAGSKCVSVAILGGMSPGRQIHDFHEVGTQLLPSKTSVFNRWRKLPTKCWRIWHYACGKLFRHNWLQNTFIHCIWLHFNMQLHPNKSKDKLYGGRKTCHQQTY